jgi:ribosomal protein S6--L-glutamate ligase
MKINILVFSNLNDPERATYKAVELLRESAEKMGHELEIIKAKDCKMIFNDRSKLFVNSTPISGMKKLLSLPSFSGKNLLIHGNIIKQFELMGVRVMNSFDATSIAKNKISMLQALSVGKIPMPKTYAVRSAEYLGDIVKEIGSYPVILKSLSGSHGIGVSIVESQRGLRSVAEMFLDSEDSGPLTIQEYVKESSGKDIRIFIVGGKIITAMERTARKRGEFRSNFVLGGKVAVAELSEEEKRLAKRAAKACGLDFSGVDLIRTKNGPKILEVNSNPGLEGITQATGKDIAGELIKYYLKA